MNVCKGVLGGLVLVMALSSVALAKDVEVVVEDGHGSVVAHTLGEVAAAIGAPVTFDATGQSVVIHSDSRGLELDHFTRLAAMLGRPQGCVDLIELGGGKVARRIDLGTNRNQMRDVVAASLRALIAAEGLQVTLCFEPGVCDCMHESWLVAVGAPEDVRLVTAICEQLRDARLDELSSQVIAHPRGPRSLGD